MVVQRLEDRSERQASPVATPLIVVDRVTKAYANGTIDFDDVKIVPQIKK